MADGRVLNGSVGLATRDYGGDGPDLLFLPGGGQTLVDCDLLAPWLAAHHRVVAMEIRGHGASDDGPFTCDAALGDVDAVVAALGLHEPAVVGHSLGGMLAAMYGAQRPSLGVVNLDGHGELRAEHYAGLEPELLATRTAELRALADAALAAREAQPVLPEAALEAMVASYCSRFGLDEAVVQAVLERTHVRVDGGVAPRLSVEMTLEVLSCVRALDLPAVYRACRAPLLVVNAHRPDLPQPGTPPWMAEHVALGRRGLASELGRLSGELPLMTYLEIDATHALIYEEPELVSKQVVAFLAAGREVGP